MKIKQDVEMSARVGENHICGHLWNVHNKPEEGKWFLTAFNKTKIKVGEKTMT